jgi:hypothetical protein
MTLPVPRLDDRSFDDLVEEARALIRTHQPEWTNYNPSDPGITLLELFAWLCEMLIYRADQVPERHKRAFLRLLHGPNGELLRLLNGPDWTPPPSSSVDDEIARTSTGLRSRYRAVTREDYEALALKASPSAARVLCLPRRDLGASREDERLAERPGYVSVVVLPVKGLPEGQEGEVRTTVDGYLDERRLLGTRNVVAEPVWAPLSAEVMVAPRRDVPESQAQELAARALEDFLDPWRGGSDRDGWPFGRDVYCSELYALLERLPEIDYVPEVLLRAGRTGRRSVAAKELWNEDGDQVGVQLASHHLPRTVIDPAMDILASHAFVPIHAKVTLAPKPGVRPADATRAVKQAMRLLFHPRHNGRAVGEEWRKRSDNARDELGERVGAEATVTDVRFEGDAAHVSSGERDVVTVSLGRGELADLRIDVVTS